MALANSDGSSCSIASTNCATRPRLWTASARVTTSGSAPRDRSVEVVRSGIQTTTDADVSFGPARKRIAQPSTHATTPPNTDAAALSPCPSSATATSSTTSRAATSAASRSSARTSAPSAAPPTCAAPLKPSPRPIGIDVRTHIGGVGSVVAPDAANARDVGWCRSIDRAPTGASPIPTSRCRSSAIPSTSNPAPRFADDAGTRTAMSSFTRRGLARPARALRVRPGLDRHRWHCRRLRDRRRCRQRLHRPPDPRRR